MIRGTTPTITYGFPFSVEDLTKFRMYFIQGQEVVLTKDETDCAIEDGTVSVTLTQEETYNFSPKKLLQTRARFVLDDTVYGTKPKNLKVEGVDGSAREVL